jgi:cell fate regulator YaaT (PSP1 superfamily)
MPGINIVGVQFRRAGKIYDFDARDFPIALGDKVVVETERGPSLAEVKRIEFTESALVNSDALKPIVRLASGKDQEGAGRLTGEQAEYFTKQKIKDLNLDMRVINVEIQFGGNKVIVYFSAPGRVDFRELVKELAGGLKTRVELKQVGARDEAKLAGGLGICGREFCCSSFLREFVPVSIKMAKNQNLALNPSKVSGGCGRLLCCLTYEDETYSSLRQRLLPKGARVRLQEGILGDVVRGDILNQVMQVELDTGELRTVPIAELEVVEAKAGIVEDDWGSDLNFGSLISGDIASLDDSEEISRHRESAAEPISGGPKPAIDRPQRIERRPDSRGPKPQRDSSSREVRPVREGRVPAERAPRELRGPRPGPAQGSSENRSPRGDRRPKSAQRGARDSSSSSAPDANPIARRPQSTEAGDAPQIIKPRKDKKED